VNKRHVLLAVSSALILGFGVIGSLDGPIVPRLWQTRVEMEQGQSSAHAKNEGSGDSVSPVADRSDQVTRRQGPTPALAPLMEGTVVTRDLEDVLLLYDSTQVRDFDINFCRVAEYYGLLCRRIDLHTTELRDALLHGGEGAHFRLIGVDAENLLGGGTLLTEREIDLLDSGVRVGGADLVVSHLREYPNTDVLADLTQGGVIGVSELRDLTGDWTVSAESPEITRELTGRTFFSGEVTPQGIFTLVLGEQTGATVLLTTTDEAGEAHPVFVRVERGAGAVFIDASGWRGNVEERSLRSMYYDTSDFSGIVPLMLATRHSLGDETWHSSYDYANLTVDDPTLTEPFGHLSFIELLREMEVHNFHTTIAFVPKYLGESEDTVVNLFLAHPDRYSLVQHGNNHDGYEFFSVSAAGEIGGQVFAARPLAEQEADIVQGLARMDRHSALTGIPFDRVMIFPWGVSPESTLVLLKKYNFLATVNAQDLPLEAVRPSEWDYGMYQANMDFGNFPTLTRRPPGSYEPIRPDLQPFILDLFLGKPALFYSHEDELFKGGIDGFDQVADEINNLARTVEWRSLGYIISHLYLEKTNDDGGVSIKMYGNDLIVANEFTESREYHILKEETLNVPILAVTVNGYDFPYHVESGVLALDVQMPAESTMEIHVQYGN